MSRKMLGGLILLNLCAISLNLTAGETAIENQEVLNQLVDLRNFIDEKRDFTKESKGLKPVVVAYRSSASKIDGIMNCNLSFNTDALHLSIAGYSVQADGTPITLTINVEYEFTEYVGYTIKSATINATKTFAVDTITGDLPLEKIVDANGHKRFIEGDIEIETITGVTKIYGKWALSGTHLLIVLVLGLANESVVADGIKLATLSDLPEWIVDKIMPLWADRYITYYSPLAYADNWQTQNFSVSLDKRNVLKTIEIYKQNAVTLTADRNVRIAFDILIDNAEESEE